MSCCPQRSSAPLEFLSGGLTAVVDDQVSDLWIQNAATFRLLLVGRAGPTPCRPWLLALGGVWHWAGPSLCTRTPRHTHTSFPQKDEVLRLHGWVRMPHPDLPPLARVPATAGHKGGECHHCLCDPTHRLGAPGWGTVGAPVNHTRDQLRLCTGQHVQSQHTRVPRGCSSHTGEGKSQPLANDKPGTGQSDSPAWGLGTALPSTRVPGTGPVRHVFCLLQNPPALSSGPYPVQRGTGAFLQPLCHFCSLSHPSLQLLIP